MAQTLKIPENAARAGTDIHESFAILGCTTIPCPARAATTPSTESADTVVQLDADDSITLLGVNVGDLHDDDFLI